MCVIFVQILVYNALTLTECVYCVPRSNESAHLITPSGHSWYYIPMQSKRLFPIRQHYKREVCKTGHLELLT